MALHQLVKETWIDLLNYLKNPVDKEDSNQEMNLRTKRLFTVFAIEIPIMVVLIMVISVLEYFNLFKSDDHFIMEILENWSYAEIIFLIGMLIPFIEELIFRFYLRLKSNHPLQFIAWISSFWFGDKVRHFIEEKWHKYYSIIFYVVTSIFALVHIFNYEISLSLLLLAPLLVSPQFVGGLFIGYMRVRFGFIWGFFLHSIHNILYVVIALAMIEMYA